MTSTNDGKDVKSNQSSGQKGKTYYIELYKTLDGRLSGEGDVRERTRHLCETWRRVHSICQHSASTTNLHLLSWLQKHTAQVILQTEWQSPSCKDAHTSLESAINDLIEDCKAAKASRDGVSPPWEQQLQQRAEWFKKNLENPWGHPVLRVLLDPRGQRPTDDEILKWLKDERGMMFVTRLRQLATSKCDDLAMALVTAVMDRARATNPLLVDNDQPEREDKPTASKEGEPTFVDILKNEADFTTDVWDLLTDIEFVLLHKSDRVSKCIELAKQTPLSNGYQLVDRLQARLETLPREKKLWKNAKEVAILIAQVMIARCMLVPVCVGTASRALYSCARALSRLLPSTRLPAAAATLAAPAATARHLHMLATAVDAQCSADMKPFVCELYVRAITAGMNELERFKLTTEKETEARSMEKTLCMWFTQLGALLSASNRIKCECTLTAFSVHPSPAMYEKIKSAPTLPPVAVPDDADTKHESTSEFGSWATDSHTHSNLVKTSETLNIKHTQNQANVLSTAILTEGEGLGLSPELCQDIAVLLSGPRVKTLSWDMDRALLIENCRTYMERTHGGTKALTTELKYLNLDPSSYEHLPIEDEDETDVYYGIEKGYEHLVELQEQEEVLWPTTIFDPEMTESCSSGLEYEFGKVSRKKKHKKIVISTDEEERDPLGTVAENKKKEVKKERPHSKERSSKERKERKKKTKSAEGTEENKERSRERRKSPEALVKTEATDKEKKKEKKPRKKKTKEEKEQVPVDPKPGSLSSLIGMKVAKIKIPEGEYKKTTETNVKPSITDSDYDSQGKSSLASLNSEGNDPDVLFDGLFSMDDYKSPEKNDPPSKRNSFSSGEVSFSNGQVSVHSQYPYNQYDIKPNIQSLPQNPQVSPSQTLGSNANRGSAESVREEVKKSLSKLLEFRRQKILLNESHKALNSSTSSQNSATHKTPNTSNSRLTGSIVQQALPDQTITHPKTEYSDRHNVYMNKKQVEQLNDLKTEVDNYLKSKFSPKPVIQYASKHNDNNTHQNSTAVTRHEHVQPPTYQDANTARTIQHTNIAGVNYTHQSTKPVNQNQQKNFQDFLRELQETINAGTGTNGEQPSKTTAKRNKCEIKPISRVTPVIPSSTKKEPSSQCAKTLPGKKVDTQLNTFSRLSYMHKNKQNTELVIGQYDQNVINRYIEEQRLAKSKHVQSKGERMLMQSKGEVVATKFNTAFNTTNNDSQHSVIHKTEKPSSLVLGHSVLASLIQKQDSTSRQMNNTDLFKYQTPAPERVKESSKTFTKNSALSDRDQNDLLLLLRQQSKLNTHVPTVTKTDNYIVNNIVSNPQCSKLNTEYTSTSNKPKKSVNSSLNKNHPVETYGNKSNNSVSKYEDSSKAKSTFTSTANKSLTTFKNHPADTCVKTSHNKYEGCKIKTMYDVPKEAYTKIVDCKTSKVKTILNKVVNVTPNFTSPTNSLHQFNEQPSINKSNVTSNTTQTLGTNPQDWEKVMDAILSHKTPSRGPNALDMVLKKNSFSDLRNQRIVRPGTTATVSNVPKEQKTTPVLENQGSSVVKTPTPVQHANLNLTSVQHLQKPSEISIKASSVAPSREVIKNVQNSSKTEHMLTQKIRIVTKTQNAPSISQSSKVVDMPHKQRGHSKIVPQPFLQSAKVEASSIQGAKKSTSDERNKRVAQDSSRKQCTKGLLKEKDPFISGIQNSDYDLLEELMDDELRKEIGELSSDEDVYHSPIAGSVKVTKTMSVNNKSNVIKGQLPHEKIPTASQSSRDTIIKSNQTHVLKSHNSKPENTTKPSTSTSNLTNAGDSKPKVIGANTVICPSNISHQPISTNVTPLLNTEPPPLVPTNSVNMVEASNVIIAAVPQPPIQNVVLIGSDIVFDPYLSMQTQIQSGLCKVNQGPAYGAFRNVPNITVYQTTQFAAPVVNPVIIGNAMTMPISNMSPKLEKSSNSDNDKLKQSSFDSQMHNTLHLNKQQEPESLNICKKEQLSNGSKQDTVVKLKNLEQINDLTNKVREAEDINFYDGLNVDKFKGQRSKTATDQLVNGLNLEMPKITNNRGGQLKEDVKQESQKTVENSSYPQVNEEFKQKVPTEDKDMSNQLKQQEAKVLDINLNKSCERKVLSEVQEKQKIIDKTNNLKGKNKEIMIFNNLKEKQKEIECVTSEIKNHKESKLEKENAKNLERLHNKRLAIMNREITHHSNYPPIPLSYMPLTRNNPNTAVLTTETQQSGGITMKRKINEETVVNNENSFYIGGRHQTNKHKESNNNTQCRRILLRSSNELKANIDSSLKAEGVPVKEDTSKGIKIKIKINKGPTKEDIPVDHFIVQGDSTKQESKQLKRVSKKGHNTHVKTKKKAKTVSTVSKECKKQKKTKSLDKKDNSITDMVNVEEISLASSIPKTNNIHIESQIVPVETSISKDDTKNEEKINEELNTVKSKDVDVQDLDKNVTQLKQTKNANITSNTKNTNTMLFEKQKIRHSNRRHTTRNSSNNMGLEINSLDSLPEKSLTKESTLKHSDAMSEEKHFPGQKINSLNTHNTTDIETIAHPPLNAETSLQQKPSQLILNKPRTNNKQSQSQSEKQSNTDVIKTKTSQLPKLNNNPEITKPPVTSIPQPSLEVDNSQPNVNVPGENIELMSLEKDVKIEELPSSDEEPDKKRLRIILPNGKVFKATVFGQMHVSFQSLFSDPSLKMALMNNLCEKKRYTLNVKQISTMARHDPKKVFHSRIEEISFQEKSAPKPVETVNLLSDDEDVPDHKNKHIFKTEFGMFNASMVDAKIYELHQKKFDLKSVVMLNTIDIPSNSATEVKSNETNSLKNDVIVDCEKISESAHECQATCKSVQPLQKNGEIPFVLSNDVPLHLNTIVNESRITCKSPIVSKDHSELTPPVLNNENEVIEIDDSSNDSVNLLDNYDSMPELQNIVNISTALSSDVKDIAPEGKIIELKNLLLQDLGVKDVKNSVDNIPLKPINEETVGHINEQVPCENECYVNLIRCDDVVKKYEHLKILKRKCTVDLFRCDHMVKEANEILTDELKLINSDSDEIIDIGSEGSNLPTPSELSRWNSFSLLNDFPFYTGETSNECLSINASYDDDRTSPVIDVYDTIAAFKNCYRTIPENENLTRTCNINCYGEWFKTKHEMHIDSKTYYSTYDTEAKNSSSYIIDNIKLPSLKTLSANVFKHDNTVLDRYVNFKKTITSSPFHRLKRKIKSIETNNIINNNSSKNLNIKINTKTCNSNEAPGFNEGKGENCTVANSDHILTGQQVFNYYEVKREIQNKNPNSNATLLIIKQKPTEVSDKIDFYDNTDNAHQSITHTDGFIDHLVDTKHVTVYPRSQKENINENLENFATEAIGNYTSDANKDYNSLCESVKLDVVDEMTCNADGCDVATEAISNFTSDNNKPDSNSLTESVKHKIASTSLKADTYGIPNETIGNVTSDMTKEHCNYLRESINLEDDNEISCNAYLVATKTIGNIEENITIAETHKNLNESVNLEPLNKIHRNSDTKDVDKTRLIEIETTETTAFHFGPIPDTVAPTDDTNSTITDNTNIDKSETTIINNNTNITIENNILTSHIDRKKNHVEKEFSSENNNVDACDNIYELKAISVELENRTKKDKKSSSADSNESNQLTAKIESIKNQHKNGYNGVNKCDRVGTCQKQDSANDGGKLQNNLNSSVHLPIDKQYSILNNDKIYYDDNIIEIEIDDRTLKKEGDVNADNLLKESKFISEYICAEHEHDSDVENINEYEVALNIATSKMFDHIYVLKNENDETISNENNRQNLSNNLNELGNTTLQYQDAMVDIQTKSKEIVSESVQISTKSHLRKEVTLVYKDGTDIILKGIEYEDPVVGTCYVFPINKETKEDEYEELSEDREQANARNFLVNLEETESILHVNIPKVTYSRYINTQLKQLKRKRGMHDVKILQKKYRKGKNIDYSKLTITASTNSGYFKEYKLLLDYFSSLKFSFSQSFHRENIDVDEIIKNWPITANSNILLSEIECEHILFQDNEQKETSVNPLDLSFIEEINETYNEPKELFDNVNETNFNMGFGEGSDRVKQNLENKDDISKVSAATLSDVKQPQPFLLSENYERITENITIKQDELNKMKQYLSLIQLKDKVRSFFKQTTIELSYDAMKKEKDDFYSKHRKNNFTNDPFELCRPDFIKPAPIEAVVQVVQVGQLPVSAAAQNPVTCDPRVTQVSDVSPSQCSVDNSPQDDSQVTIKTEYTELTTADLTLPLQEYAHHNQSISVESQDPSNLPLSSENIPIETEIKSVVKIELMEELPEVKEETRENFEHNEYDRAENKPSINTEYTYDTTNSTVTNTTNATILQPDTDFQTIYDSTEKQSENDTYTPHKQQNGSPEKTDQIAHAMNAAGITTTAETITNTNRAHALVNILSQKLRQGAIGTSQSVSNSFTKTTAINAMALQQALAQILPPPLNQTNSSENNQQTSTQVTPQVLHIVQGKNASGSQITLVDNSSQSVISNQNATPVLHIVQNKTGASVATSNGTATSQANTFSGLSLVDTGLQQGGNQLLHIVNTGNQKNSNATGQLLKRVNLLTNLTNVQGSNEQKMVQFVCKSADGKSIQLNAPHQRSMVLRLQPIESPNVNIQTTPPKPAENQDMSPQANTSNSSPSKDNTPSQHEIKSRSVYEENYAKFIQNSSNKTSISEKSTSLPKFNQAFGKPVFQEGNQKQNEISVNNGSEGECQSSDNAINIDHIGQISSPPLLLRKSPQTSQSQTNNLVQQLKQTIAPMNIQTMHGGVIYTRQIPVNIGGGQTINLITVPSTELIDESGQKQPGNQTDIEQSIIKIVPQTQTNSHTEISQEDGNSQISGSNETSTSQPQPVLTQMRIKLPMLSKNPQMVAGARVVRPSFFQIQRNVIGGANQPVYQQLVLTAAPPLGQQTIRLPQTQTTRQIKVPTENQSSTESQMSSSTLEQLREFDMVLEQVKERSTVQPSSSTATFPKLHTPSNDTTDGGTVGSSSSTETTQQVLYSIGNSQPLNVAYVNRKSTVTTPTTSTFVRSPDSSGIIDSPTSTNHTQIPHTVTSETTQSEPATQSKPVKVSSKSKSRPKASSNPPNNLKLNTVPPKTSTQKPLEDEQTTQRILYILAEYKEQVENSPDKDKPAPRRRSNPPSNPSGSSKRKKSSSSSRRPGVRDLSPIHGEDTCRTMGSEDSSCGTSQGDCNESCLESHSPQDSPRKVVRKLTFEQEAPTPQPRPQPQRNVIVADGQTITVARGTAGKPTTAVLMPANYILPVSMVKGGQQIAIVTNRGPKLLTVGGEGGATNALLLQRLIGPAGLKPVLTRPGVRHVRLPTAALHNLQAFNLATATTIQPPDSTASPAPGPTPPELIDTRATSSPWTDREAQDVKPERASSPEGSEPWHLPSSGDPHDYSYEETVRADNLDRTVLDPIPDRYSPDMEAQRIFDKMFDVDSKKSYMGDSHDDSPRCAYDIDASDCDDKAYHQVVQKKDGSSHRQHRLTHVSAAALRHKYAILEHELRLQKSLSEECEDLGVDSPSASELFPEAELLFAASPAHDHTQDQGHHSHTPQPTLLSQSGIPQPDIDDQIATDQLLTRDMSDHQQDLNLGLEDVGIVTVSEDGMQATIALDQEEFARSHPNTTFHSEPTDEGEVQPFTIAGLKGRHITSTIFHSNRAPATVLMTTPQTTVISQATPESCGHSAVKYSDIDNMINSLPSGNTNNINLSSVLVKDQGLTRFDNILSDSRELHLSHTASAIVHSAGNATQVIRRVCYDDDKRDTRFLMDEPDALIAGDDAKMIAEDSSRDATMESMAEDVDDDRSSPERHAELFWESNSASERSESRRPLDFSSDSEKCCKSPSYDETNSTDSSGVGTNMRLDSVIKDARGMERSGSADGSSADDTHPPLRTYPPKRLYHPLESDMERSLSGKTRAGERSPDSLEVRRRASGRGVVKRGCHCCNGSPAPPRPKKSRQRKPTMDFTTN